MTAILLLLSLPVLAGDFEYLIAPALNLAICWKHFLNNLVVLARRTEGEPDRLSPPAWLRER